MASPAVSTEIYLKILSVAKCLRGFGFKDLEDLLTISHRVAWKAGDRVFSEQDQGRDMFVICSGKISIYRETDRGKLALASLGIGESFGEIGLVRAGTRSASASAATDTLALRVDHQRLYTVPNVSALLYKNIAGALAERLSNANDIIVFQAQSGGMTPAMSTADGGPKRDDPPEGLNPHDETIR